MRDQLIAQGLWDAADPRDPTMDNGAAWAVAERLRATMDLCVVVRLYSRRGSRKGGCRVGVLDGEVEVYVAEGAATAATICQACELASRYSGWETTTR